MRENRPYFKHRRLALPLALGRGVLKLLSVFLSQIFVLFAVLNTYFINVLIVEL